MKLIISNAKIVIGHAHLHSGDINEKQENFFKYKGIQRISQTRESRNMRTHTNKLLNARMTKLSLSSSAFYLGIVGLASVLVAHFVFEYPLDQSTNRSVFFSMFLLSASLTSALSGFLCSLIAIFNREQNSKLIFGLISGGIGVFLNPIVHRLYNGI